MSVYVVDTNFFIQAHRDYYPLDIVPSFWDKVKELSNAGIIISLDKVKKEIYKNNDALKDWCKTNLPENFFKDPSPAINEYGAVIAWASGRLPQYTQSALTEFMDAEEADAFIVAYTLADNGNKIVVTQEISSPLGMKKVKIPDACDAVGVGYLNTIEMFRELGESF